MIYYKYPLCCLLLLFGVVSYSDTVLASYPNLVSIIEKNKAQYDTPENAFTSLCSAQQKRDLVWYFETLTLDSSSFYKEIFAQNNIDLMRIFDSVEDGDITFIVDRKNYKDGVLLIVETQAASGHVLRGPTMFVKEAGLWKSTVKYRDDDEMEQYFEVVDPPEFISPFSVLLHPDQFEIEWFNRIKGQIDGGKGPIDQAKKETVVCVLQSISGSSGEKVSVTEIIHDSIMLNEKVAYIPWMSKGGKQIDTVVLAKPGDYLPGEFNSLNSWWKKAGISYSEENPVMLIKFNKYDAMRSLPDMVAGKEYEITISGKLKNSRQFKGIFCVTMTEGKTKGNK